MKNSDSSLDRLLRAAGQSRPVVADEIPFGFATRVVSGWIAGAGRERMGLEALWFRRAFLCSVAVMAVSVGWSFKTDTTAPNDEMAIASYAATADLQ
jgi:hypothetical protein